MKELSQLLPINSNIEIHTLSTDSRQKSAQSIFFCLKGLANDGHLHVLEAIENGALVIVHSDDVDMSLTNVVYHRVEDVNECLNTVLNIFYEDPSSHLKMIGVTGTNGKSTIAKTLKELLNNELPCGYSGTISIEYGSKTLKPNYTTPESIEFVSILHDMVHEGMKAASLEISSQGLDQRRVDAVKFDYAIFTNLTHDHLDYHGTMENYYLSKKHLFELLKDSAQSIINIDDAYGERLYKELSSHKYSYSTHKHADYRAEHIHYGAYQTTFTLITPKEKFEVKTNFVAEFNLSNLLSVIAVYDLMGFSLSTLVKRLESLPAVEGRMNVLTLGQKFTCVVDYAHTPDGFKKIFEFAKTITPSHAKIIAVYGAAGHRDKKKRAILGQISDEYADRIILTEEDPRTESALEIAQQISMGIEHTPYVIVLDRYDAIFQACELASKDDTVLILAKGNEQYMARKNGKEFWMGDEAALSEIIKGKLNETE